MPKKTKRASVITGVARMMLTKTATACDRTGTRHTLVIARIRPSGAPMAMLTLDIQRVVTAPPTRLAIIPQSIMTSDSPRCADCQFADVRSPGGGPRGACSGKRLATVRAHLTVTEACELSVGGCQCYSGIGRSPGR